MKNQLVQRTSIPEQSSCWMQKMQGLALAALVVGAVWLAPAAQAQTVTLAQTPLLALKTAPGLVMLTLSRDHRLFYAAYSDTSDIDGDGVVDVGFKPTITYYGNFVSDRCYDYITTGSNQPLYRPTTFAVADDNTAGSSTGCRSGATQRWHGNWLNWATTSRMDALRRVLYGGYRVLDNTTNYSVNGTSTVLQGAYIPKDSHVWGKEYRPVTRDTYDIRKYTALVMPTVASGVSKQHLFVVVSPTTNSTATNYGFLQTSVAPVLRYITDADQTTERIWFWASADVAQGIANSPANFTKGGGRTSVTPTDLVLKVEACVPLGAGLVRETGCVGYPTSAPTVWKPTGVLHDYGATDSLKFGLLTGTYQNNYSGGVVRRNIRSFKDEFSATNGTFTDNAGIARTIDRIAIHGWGGSQYDCGYKTDGDRPQGTCRSWGAPIAEMMYEGLRFFSGKGTATSAYASGVAGGTDTTMGFADPVTWQNPFQSKSQAVSGATYGNPICSRPVQMVIADPLTSRDSDQLPGAYFSPPAAGMGTALGSNDLVGLNVTTEADAIWSAESLGTRNVFIGQSGTVKDGNPTPKSANSFATIRGHAPDETRAEGTYYSASVARFARGQKNVSTGVVTNGIPIGNPAGSPGVPTVPNTQVDTLAIALGSLTPRIEIPNPAGGVVTVVPISKGVGNAGINKTPGQYQATGAITGFYFANYTATSIQAVVNFSDGNEGTDNETDAQAVYDITIAGTAITVKMSQLDKYPGGIESHMGYVISGTTADGMYLDMRTSTGGSGTVVPQANVYYLDTLPGQAPAPALPSVRSNGSVAVATPAACPAGACPSVGVDICPAYDPSLSSVATPYGINPLLPAGGSAAAVAERNYKLALIAKLDTCLPSWGGKTTPNAQTSRAFAMATVPTTTGYIPKDPLWYAAKYGGAGIVDSNGDPTNYFKVTNPSKLPEQIGKAFRSAAALAAVASTSVVGVGQRSVGTAALYQATFESLTWTSRLYAFKIDSAGAVSNTPVWDAAAVLPSSPAARLNMYLGQGGSTSPVKLVSGGFATLAAAEQADFGSSDIYQFLLGEKSKEERKGGVYRNRGSTSGTDYGSVLGDIVNSDPQIIAKTDYGYGGGTSPDTDYAPFVAGLNKESIAVGSNDGFFHIFNADPTTSGGNEIFAFMPQAARPSVKDLSSPGYQHRYFVDGSIGQGHAKIATPDDSTVAWRNVVVAAGGSGVKTVFAINTPNSQIYTAKNVLWEINANTTLPITGSLGNVEGRPAIGKLSSAAGGTWVAVFGNGYNSTAGTSSLVVVNLATGAIIAQIPTDAVTASGLGSTVIARKSTDNTIEYVYGADYKGNIWRFNLSGAVSGWTNQTNIGRVYQTPTGRPITGEITVSAATGDPSVVGGKMIAFGTGSFLNTNDVNTTTPAQALYGIYDALTWTLFSSTTVPGVLESTLVPMTITMAAAANDTRLTTTVAAGSAWYNQTGKKGWVVPLSGTNVAAGERVIAPPTRYTVAGTLDAVLFTSIVPSTDECIAGVDAWITAVDAMTGGYTKAFAGITNNSIKVSGGSPRGVFVLQDGGTPMLFISQTVFNGIIPSTSYTTSTGGVQAVTTGGSSGQTQTVGVTLTGAPGGTSSCIGSTCKPNSVRSSGYWRQLK